MITLSVGTQKGGPGKTTMTLNLAGALALAGLRVGVADFDLQADATVGLGVTPSEECSIGTLILKPGDDVNQHLVDVTHLMDENPNGGRLVLLPAEQASLDRAAYEMQRHANFRALANAVRPLEGELDYLLIDSKPELGILHLNSVQAADAAVTVMYPQMATTRGGMAFRTSLEAINESRPDRKIQFLGVILNEYEEGEEAGWVIDILAEQQIPVFDTRIPRSRLISKSYSYGRPCVLQYPTSKAAAQFVALAGEVVQRASSAVAA